MTRVTLSPAALASRAPSARTGSPWRAWRVPAPLLLGALAVAAICLVPPVYLVVRASDDLAVARDAILDGGTLRLTLRTLALSATVTALAAAIALPLAWLTTSTDLPWRRAFAVLTVLPLAVPSYVGALVAVSAFGPRGLLQQALEPAGVDRLPGLVFGFAGATVVLALFTYPYMLLTLRPALGGLDPRLQELSRGFGYGRWTTFRRIVLPQLRPALLSGGLLVALYTLADFGAVSLLRVRTLTTHLLTLFESTFNFTSVAALSLVLATLALALVTFEVWSRGRRRYDAVGRNGNGRAAPVELGRWRWPAVAFVAVVLLLALAVPAAVLGYWLVRGVEAGEALRGLGGAVRGSLLGASFAALFAALAALPVALLSVRHRAFPLSRPIEVVSYTGYALPGLVVGLALVFAGLNLGPLYQSFALLVVAYALLFLPQAVGATRVALLQVRPSMEEAARGLGRRPWQVLTGVTIPLAGRGIAAGAALVFLTTIKELPATLVLAPTGFETLATHVWSAADQAFFARAALPALLLIALSALPLLLLDAWRRD